MASIDEMLFDALRRSNPIGRVIEDFKRAQPDLQAATTAPTGAAEALIGKLMVSPAFRTSATEEEARRRALEQDDLFVKALLGFEQAQGNPIQRAMAANEAGAQGREIEQGVYNMFLDPTNLIPIPTGKVGKVANTVRQNEKLAQLMAGVTDAGNGDDLAALIEDAGKTLPLAPEKKDLAAYMKSLGLGKPEAVDNIPSPLVPERTPNLLQLARDGNGVVETNRLNLPLDPSIGDLRTQLRNAQMPQVIGANDLAAPSSLVPDKVPNLLRIAREAQGGKVPSLTAPVKGARAINARAGQIGLPESIPATELDKFLRVSESVVGDLPPEGASFWARNGIPNEQVPSLFEASRKAGAMGQTADALLLDSPLLSNVDIPSRAPELPASGMGVRALNAAVDLAYGGKQQFAFPALLKRIGGRVDKTGVIWVGDRNVTNDVFEYLYASYDAKGKRAKDLLREQLMERVGAVDDIAPASTPSVVEDLATKVDEFGREYTQLPAQIDEQGNLVYPRQYGNYKGNPSGVDDYVPTAEDLANGWGSEISLPFDQQPPRRTRTADFTPAQWVSEIEQRIEREKGILSYVRAKDGADSPGAKEVSERIAGLRGALKEARIVAKNPPSGSSMNFTVPGLNAAINLGTKALTNQATAAPLIGGLTGGAAGATTGGITGALATPEDRWGGFKQGAAGGAVLGAALGAGSFAYGLNHVTPEAWSNLTKHSWELARKDVVATTEDAVGSSILPTPKQLISFWKNQTVSTMRQFGQDGTWNRLVLDLLQGKGSKKLLGEITQQISERMTMKGFDRLSVPLQERLKQFGKQGYEPQLGVPIVESVAMHGLSRSKSVVSSALLSTFGPGNVVGGLAGAAKGAAMPEFSGMIRHANGALNRGFRETAFVDELDNKLIPLAVDAFKRLGYDLSSVPVDQLTRATVEQMYGAKAGAMWQKTMENMIPMAESRVRYLFGDYTPGQKGAIGIIEKITGPGMPFSSWAIRAYPVALDMAIQNPWVALGVYQFLQATAGQAGKDGRPRWTAGKLPISTEVPLLGAGARTLLGGQKGTAYVDPVGSLSPVGGDLFQPGADQEGPQSLYQQVSEIIGRAGLPGLSPFLQGIAYMLGLDYKGPGNMSRTQGMENSLGLIPGNIDLPGWGDVALRAGRAKLSPAFAGTEIGAKLGAQGDKYPTVYDPVARRYGELVVKATQKSLDDPANRAYLYDLAAGTGELYDQARREVLLGGLARNAFSTTSPIGVATQGEGAREARREREGVPYDYTALQAIKAMDIPSFMREAELQNRQYKEANPASASYAVGSRAEAEDILMQDVLDRFRGKRPPSPAAEQQQLASILAAAGRGAQYRNLTPPPTEPVAMPAPRRIAPEPKK